MYLDFFQVQKQAQIPPSCPSTVVGYMVSQRGTAALQHRGNSDAGGMERVA